MEKTGKKPRLVRLRVRKEIAGCARNTTQTYCFGSQKTTRNSQKVLVWRTLAQLFVNYERLIR